jgi:hypothetical protein
MNPREQWKRDLIERRAVLEQIQENRQTAGGALQAAQAIIERLVTEAHETQEEIDALETKIREGFGWEPDSPIDRLWVQSNACACSGIESEHRHSMTIDPAAHACLRPAEGTVITVAEPGHLEIAFPGNPMGQYRFGVVLERGQYAIVRVGS